MSGPRVLRLTLAYDGTEYAGWQVQPHRPTVQGRLLQAARWLLGPDAAVTGASRTDAGVHALRQTASVRGVSALEAWQIRGALNARLPPDIRVLQAADAPPGFDARRAATGKRYAYLLDTAPVASPLLRRFAWHVPRALDLDAMRLGLRGLLGRHDFSAFCAAPGLAAPRVCRLQAVHVLGGRGRAALLVSADRFLHHMVRNIVGSAILVGLGRRPAAWLADVLRQRRRSAAGPTAPPQGLVLVRVLYGTGERSARA